MQVYISNVIIAAVVFPLVALAITVPYLVYQYRKFGSIPWWRTFVVYLFAFYLLCAYFLVILPLPEDRTAIVAYAQHPQIIPFAFIGDIAFASGVSLADPSTWLSVLKASGTYVALFNILILVPLGMFLRYYVKRRWWQALLIGFATTLFFELSQITGLFGIYEHPYRLFDVDDLILNTSGVMLGFWVMGPAQKALPNMTVINQEARRQGVSVSLPRRILSFVIDVAIAQLMAAVISAGAALFGMHLPAAIVFGGLALPTIPLVVSYAFFFVLAPSLLRGQTLGQKLLKLMLVRPDASPAHWHQILGRYTVVFLLVYGPPLLFSWLQSLVPGEMSEISALATALHALAPWLAGLWALALVCWFFSVLLRNRKAKEEGTLLVLLFDLMSGTRIMTVEGVERLRDRTVILDVAEVAALEYMIAEDALSLAELMDRAGKSVVEDIERRNPEPTGILVLCGSGNNGGDGWVVARELAGKGYAVTVVSPVLPTELDADPARSAAMEAFADSAPQTDRKPSVGSAGGGSSLRVVVKPHQSVLEHDLEQSEVIVDALLGTGFSGQAVREPFASWIEAVNSYRRQHKESYVIAVDVPSGFSAQTGQAAQPCIIADATVTMLAYKPGLFSKQAEQFCGQISLSRLTDISPYLDRFQKAAKS